MLFRVLLCIVFTTLAIKAKTAPIIFGSSTSTTNEVLFTDATNTLANPSAIVATWKVRATYNGSCWRVRRSSDQAELDIGFNGNNLDSAAQESFVGVGNDGFLALWYDQGTNSHNLLQTTAGSQFMVVSNGITLKDGGIPYAVSDGNTRNMATTNWGLTTPLTIYLTCNVTNGNAQFDCIMDGNSINTIRLLRGASDTAIYAWNALTGTLSVNKRITITAMNNITGSGQMSVALNNATAITGNGVTMTPNGLIIGRNSSGGSPIISRYFMIAVYPSVHSTNTISVAHTNINAKVIWN